MSDTPGVSANELAQEPGPLQAVANSIGAMFGTAERGEANVAVKLTNWEQFKLKYGINYAGSFLAYAVKGFFDNGGSDLYVVRVMKAGVLGAVKATINFKENDNLADVLSVTAATAGVAGNSIRMKIEVATIAAEKYKITITDGITPEIYDEVVDTTAAAAAIDGGVLCDAVALSANKTLMLIGNTYLLGGAAATTGVANSTITLVDRSAVDTLEVTAITPGVWGDRLSVVITDSLLAAATAFTLVVKLDGVVVETFSELTMALAAGAINGISEYITVTNLASVTAIPGNRPAVATSTLAAGNDGAAPGDAEFSDFTALNAIDENLNIAVPGRPGTSTSMAITIAGIAYAAASGKHVFVSDYATGRAKADVKSDRALLGSQSYGASYWPWILSSDIFGSGSNPVIYLPSSGHALGVMARIGASRGVHKAPAGSDCGIVGAIGLQTVVDADIQGELNPLGINCIRVFSNTGVTIFGARTLSYESKWKFLNVRLYINRVKSTFRKDFFFSVFEINDETLWAQLLRRGRKFLGDDRKARALFGSTDEQAFFLKCDAELNTTQVTEAGQLKYRIGLNPTRPAEQIILEVTQFDGTAQITEA